MSLPSELDVTAGLEPLNVQCAVFSSGWNVLSDILDGGKSCPFLLRITDPSGEVWSRGTAGCSGLIELVTAMLQ